MGTDKRFSMEGVLREGFRTWSGISREDAKSDDVLEADKGFRRKIGKP